MYLERVRLDNVKSFHGDRRVELGFVRPDGTYPGLTVIAGRNNSGKSSLLRAIAVAHLASGMALEDSHMTRRAVRTSSAVKAKKSARSCTRSPKAAPRCWR